MKPAARGAEFASGGTVPVPVLNQLACDALLERALIAGNGAILNLGRSTRTVSPAQRRALTARDRGCSIPGCTAPAHWCDGHHVRWWQRDAGPTDIGNLALLCGRHHAEIHAGIWVLEMRDGIPWAIPPAWADPQRRPLRNTYRDDIETFHTTGTQLRLGLSGLTEPRPPPARPTEPAAHTGAAGPSDEEPPEQEPPERERPERERPERERPEREPPGPGSG